MLSSANSGRFLSKRYAHHRNRAVEDKSLYTAAEQQYLDITGIEGTDYFQHETYEIDTQPIGSTVLKTTSKKKNFIDIREIPSHGGSV